MNFVSLESQCFPRLREILGKQNSLFPSEPVIKCLTLTSNHNLHFITYCSNLQSILCQCHERHGRCKGALTGLGELITKTKRMGEHPLERGRLWEGGH